MNWGLLLIRRQVRREEVVSMLWVEDWAEPALGRLEGENAGLEGA